MKTTFAVEYLSGLTNFTFDKAVLLRVAHKRGIAKVSDYEEVTEKQELLCTKDLLLTVIRGPWSTASSTMKHGSYEVVVGQQTITANALEAIKDQIRQINKELGLDEEDGLPRGAINEWVNDDWDS